MLEGAVTFNAIKPFVRIFSRLSLDHSGTRSNLRSSQHIRLNENWLILAITRRNQYNMHALLKKGFEALE